MASKNRTDLKASHVINLLDNNSRLITPAKLRAELSDMVDSAFSTIDGDVLPVSSGGTGATNTSQARANIGLGNVNNTADADKPVSTATQTALDAKQSLSGKNVASGYVGLESNRRIAHRYAPLTIPDVTKRNLVLDGSWSSVAAANFAWYGVCWSPELSLFCAVASSGTGTRVTTSPDGVNWTTRTSAADNSWRSVCWSAELGLFVAVAASGTGNRIMTSPDGITWTSQTNPVNNGWNHVIWAAELGLFIATAVTGTSGLIMTSPDGVEWTSRASGAVRTWASVAWSPEVGRLVVVSNSGTGNRVTTSTDGVTWTASNAAADNDWQSVCWSAERNLFVAVASSGTGNRVMTSPDGLTWTTRTSAADNNWQSVCWAPEIGLFCAVAASGTGDRVMTSPDGITWTTRTSAADNNWRSVAWSPQLGMFCAGGSTGTDNRIMVSTSCEVISVDQIMPSTTALSLSKPKLGVIKTLGYYTEGDGGGGIWKRKAAAEADEPGQITCANGIRYGYVAEGNVYRVDALGAKGDNSTDDHAAVQSAINLAWAKGGHATILFSSKIYKIGDELDFNSWGGGGTRRIQICGPFMEGTRIKPARMGASKKLFKFSSQTHGQMSDITIDGDGTARQDHPIGIYLPNCGRFHLNRIFATQLGNTVAWATRPFNVDWSNLEFWFCGYQPIHRDISTATYSVSITEGSADVVANSSAAWDDSDVGQQIVISASDSGAGRNDAWTSTIVSRAGATVTLADTCPVPSASGRPFSFACITGSITSGSTTLTLDSPVFTADDDGRLIYVKGAGASGGILVSTMTYVSSTVATLADAASTTVTNKRVYFTPIIFIGSYASDAYPNDIVLSNCLIEGFRGPAVVVEGGLHIFLNQVKTHGLAWNVFSNFGRTCEPIVWSSTNRGGINSWELEFCTPAQEGGVLSMLGNEPSLMIRGWTINGPAYGQYLIDFIPGGTVGKSFLKINSILSRGRWSWNTKGPVYFPSNSERRRVSIDHIGGYDFTHEAGYQVPAIFGALQGNMRFINNNASINYTLPSACGMVIITCENHSAAYGIFFYRADAGVCTSVAGGANFAAVNNTALGGTDGTSGNLTVSVNSGKLYIENQTGTGRWFHLSPVLG